MSTHILYISKHYEALSTVMFDGYGSVNLTKVAEMIWRAQKCTEVYTSSDIIATTTQAAFLANSNNKIRFIETLRGNIFKAGKLCQAGRSRCPYPGCPHSFSSSIVRKCAICWHRHIFAVHAFCSCNHTHPHTGKWYVVEILSQSSTFMKFSICHRWQ